MARIDKIMHTKVHTLQKSATIADAAKKLSKDPDNCVIIKDKNQTVGIVTGTDIIRFLSDKNIKSNQKITTLMSSPVTTIDSNATLEKANKTIDTKKYSNYPIVSGENVVGTVTQSDIVHSINDAMKFHRNLQNGVLALFLIYAVGIVIFFMVV